MKALLLAALLIVPAPVSAAVPFDRYVNEVSRIAADFSVQVSVVNVKERGSEEWAGEMERFIALIDDAISTLERIGHDECYRWYAETVIYSLELYRIGLRTDLENKGIIPLGLITELNAAQALGRAAGSTVDIISASCQSINGAIDPQPDPAVNAAPIA